MYGGDNTKPIYAFVVNPWIYVEDFEQYMLLLQGLSDPGIRAEVPSRRTEYS